MDLHLKGKNALITGASYGLGYSCAEALAAEGVNVAICAREQSKLDAAAGAIAKTTGSKAIGIAADITNAGDRQRMIEVAKQQLGAIDILVISTGHPPTYPFSVATDEQWETGADLLLKPPIHLTRMVLDDMRQRKYGRIIFIGSIFGLEPEKTSVVQSTFRTGLNALAKCIASEVAAEGVTVNVICPGYFETPLVTNLAKQYADGRGVEVGVILDEWREYSPVRKFGKPEDLGALVAFMASPRGEFMTGTAVTIDGGAVRQY